MDKPKIRKALYALAFRGAPAPQDRRISSYDPLRQEPIGYRCVNGADGFSPGDHMQQAFQQLLQLLQQGIAAIFRIVGAVWSWAAAQITTLMQSPWQNWPLWKQLLLAVIAVAVVFALYRAVVQLWMAGERILAGFAALLTALVRTVPSLAVAGLIAVGGMWLLNNLDLSNLRLPVWQTTSVGEKSSPN